MKPRISCQSRFSKLLILSAIPLAPMVYAQSSVNPTLAASGGTANWGSNATWGDGTAAFPNATDASVAIIGSFLNAMVLDIQDAGDINQIYAIGDLSFNDTIGTFRDLTLQNGTLNIATTDKTALWLQDTASGSGQALVNLTSSFSIASAADQILELRVANNPAASATDTTGPGVRFNSSTTWTNFLGTLQFGKGLFQANGANSLPQGVAITLGTNTDIAFLRLNVGQSQTIAALNGNAQSFVHTQNTTSAATLTINSALSGSFAGTVGTNGNGSFANSGVTIIKNGAGTQTFTGSIVNVGTIASAVTVNAGVLELNKTNTYAGVTTINAGTVTLGANETLGFGGRIGLNQARGNVLVKPGSFLDLNGKSVTEQIDLQGATLKVSSIGGGVNNGLASVSFNAAGSGLTVGSPVVLAGGGGSGASVTAYYGLDTADNNIVTIDNGGSAYTAAPTVSFTGGGGTGMAGTATITGDAVTSVTITNSGSGYTSAPTISFTGGGGGTGAAATVPSNRWKLTGVQITNAGADYTSAPTVAIVGDGSETQPFFNDRNTGGLLVGGVAGTINTLQDDADITLVSVYSSGAGRTLRKSGTGTLTLAGTGDNAFLELDVQTGNVLLNKTVAGRAANLLTLSGGTASLQPGGANNKQLVNLIINSGAFDLNGQSSLKSTVTSLSGTGGFVTNNGPADSTLYIGDGGGVYADVLTYSGVIKDGAKKTSVQVQGNATSTREVILSGANIYTGNTTVNAGKLTLGSAFLANTSTVAIGANGTLNLNHTTTDVVGKLTLGAGDQPDGIYGAVGSGAQHPIAEITGTGFIQVVAPPVSGYATWASQNGASLNPDEDHDNDGVDNGIEYFMGATGSTQTANPAVLVNGVTRTVTWPKDSGYNGGYLVETSTNLIDWSTATVVDNGTSVMYTFPAPSGKHFVRLVVTPN